MTVADKLHSEIERQLAFLDERAGAYQSVAPILNRQIQNWRERLTQAERDYATANPRDDRLYYRVVIASLQLQAALAYQQIMFDATASVDADRSQIETSRILIRLIGQKADELSEKLANELSTQLEEFSKHSEQRHADIMNQIEQWKSQIAKLPQGEAKNGN